MRCVIGGDTNAGPQAAGPDLGSTVSRCLFLVAVTRQMAGSLSARQQLRVALRVRLTMERHWQAQRPSGLASLRQCDLPL